MRSIAKYLTRCRIIPLSSIFQRNNLPETQQIVSIAADQELRLFRFSQTRNIVITTVANAQTDCWYCKKSTVKHEHMICNDCGYLQDVNTNINYFKLLDVPVNFQLEQQTLTRRFRHLQTLVHPDKFSNKTAREKSNSADWSSLINKAYKTLATPVERGQYLLRLQGQDVPQDNSALNKEFLLEMMERNEEIEDAKDNITLNKLNAQIISELDAKIKQLTEHFDAKNLEAAKSMLVEMKYLLNIQTRIKHKLQSLMIC